LLGDSTFLLVNGDTLTTLDIPSLVRDHRRTGALVTMALVPNLEPMKYGGVLLNPGGSIRGFVKPGAKEPSFHFIGVQVAEAAAFASVPEDVPYESTLALYPALIRERPGSVRGFVTSAGFLDIGTPADYLATSLALAAREGRAQLRGTDCTVAPDARLEQTILWDRVQVGRGTLLRECVVTDDVRVPPDTSWHGIAMRIPNGEMAPGERRIGDIVVASI
jgi:NDP-sugar pyrophosphorylase family protein